MKKIVYISTILIVLLGLSQKVVSQNQIGDLNGIYYQAVAVDENGKEIVGMDVEGKPLYNKAIGVRFTITKGMNGNIQWEETHTTTTDKYGLFTLVIGKGTPTGSASYTRLLDIPWIDADQFLKVEIATKNDGNYKLVSNQQFMSVPFSFYTDDIADNSITTWKIVDSTIVNIDVATGAIDSRTILDYTILNEDIATGSVDSRTILDSTIVNIDVATGAIDSRTILDYTILNEDIATGSVDSRTILDSTIVNIDVATGAIDSRTILNETILAEDIATGAVTTSEILNGTILNEDIANGTIDLTTKVTGILPVVNGGTGTNTHTANSLLYGNGTGAIQSLGQATDGQIPVGVTGLSPELKVIAGGIGINVSITPDSVIISTGIQGVNSTIAGNVNPNVINNGSTWISPAIPLPGVDFGNIIVGSINTDLSGCQMTTYVTAQNIIKVAIFNGTGANVNLGNGREIRVLIVQ